MSATMEQLVDTVIDDGRWDALGLEVLADRAARAVLEHVGLPPEGFEIVLLACDDARISRLNADFRARAQPTNVLSWPTLERGASEDGARPGRPEPGTLVMPETLGDIAIAWETCMREARDQGKNPEDHVTHLLVHAVLHLLGYDHERDKDAALMELSEVQILASLGLADPYENRRVSQ